MQLFEDKADWGNYQLALILNRVQENYTSFYFAKILYKGLMKFSSESSNFRETWAAYKQRIRNSPWKKSLVITMIVWKGSCYWGFLFLYSYGYIDPSTIIYRKYFFSITCHHKLDKKKRAYLKCPCSGRRHRKPETQYKSLITKPESLEKVNPKLQSIYQSDIPLVFLYWLFSLA